MMHFPTQNHYHLTRMQEMGRVYWCHSIGTFGVSLVAIFIPIFLIKIGYSFADVLFFLCSQQLLAAALQYPAVFLMRYINPHTMLAIGNAWFVVTFGLLATLPSYHWPLWIISLAWVCNRVPYWLGFHMTFSTARAHKRSTRQIAGLNALTIMGSTAAPAIGGLVATSYDIKFVYGAAIALLFIATIPMLFGPKGPVVNNITLSWKFINSIRRDFFANFCNGMIVTTEACIWPLFVYLLVTSYAGIGLLSTVIAASSVVLTLYVGRRQHGDDRRFIRRGVATYSLVSIGRSIAQNSVQIFGLNLFAGAGRSLYVTPFMNRYYSNSDHSNRAIYIATMEVAACLGAFLFLGGALVASLFLSAKIVLTVAVGIVAFAALGVRAIR